MHRRNTHNNQSASWIRRWLCQSKRRAHTGHSGCVWCRHEDHKCRRL